jgi:hypothetical protein
MSVESADTDDRFEDELVAILRGLGEDIEPWKLRPPESSDNYWKLHN